MCKRTILLFLLLLTLIFGGTLIARATQDNPEVKQIISNSIEKINVDDNSNRVEGQTGAMKKNRAEMLKNDSSINSQDYPEIVARVGSIEIFGDNFAKQVKETKYAYELNNDSKDKAFYEKAVLSTLITNALLDQIIEQKKIKVSDQEAKQYLESSIKTLNNNSNDEPNTKYFSDYTKSIGYANVDQYINDNKVIAATKKVLARNKLSREIAASSVAPTENEIDLFIEAQSKKEKSILDIKNDTASRERIKEYLYQKKKMHNVEVFKKDLLSQGKYDVFIPISLK